MIKTELEKGRKYINFPRHASSETFMIFGNSGYRTFMGDGRIRKIVRHSKYDEMWVQFGYFQKRKWLVSVFAEIRHIISTLEQNDWIHCVGVVEKWGDKTVYMIQGIIPFPQPKLARFKDTGLEMELHKLTKDQVEYDNSIKKYIGKGIHYQFPNDDEKGDE